MKPSLVKRTCAVCGKGPRYCPYHGPEGLECSSCYQARKYGKVRRVEGLCACGCGRTARGDSGYAQRCYAALWRRNRFFQTVVGTEVSLATITEALTQINPTELGLSAVRAEAVRAAQALFAAIAAGRVVVQRRSSSYQRPAAGFTGWRRPTKSRRTSPLARVG